MLLTESRSKLATYHVVNSVDGIVCDHKQPLLYRQTQTVTILNVSHDDQHYVYVKRNCGFFIQHNTPCRHCYCLFHEAPHVSHFPPQYLHAWALTYGEPDIEDPIAVLQGKYVEFEIHGGVHFPRGTPVPSYVDIRMSSTDVACFHFYFEKMVDINTNSVKYSKTQNNTLLTWPKRKKKSCEECVQCKSCYIWTTDETGGLW